MKIYKLLLFSVITLFYLSMNAQNVKGIIINAETNNPLQGAKVTVLDTKISVLSDENGNFTIDANDKEYLVVEFQGYKKIRVPVSEASTILLDINTINLQEIILRADAAGDITHSFVVIDQIKNGSQPRTATDLFNDIPGFSIQKRSAMAAEPSLRSFKYEQLNIKFDGCTKIVNACPNRMDPITSHIIPEEVSKIEVVRGPYTVRYGQIFGGIVNMITKKPRPEEFGIHGKVEGGYEFNGQNKVVRGEIMYAKEKFDLITNAEYRDFSDYTDGQGLIVPSGFNTIGYSVKAGINPSSNQRLQFDWRQKFGKDILHAGLPMDSPKDDSYSASLDYKINFDNKIFKALTVKSYYSFVDHLMNNHLRPNFVKMDASTPVISNTLGGKFESELKFMDKMKLFAGLDLTNESRTGNRTRIIKLKPDGTPFPEASRPVKVDSVWQDGGIKDIGIFAEGNCLLTNNLSLNMGLRTDFVNAYAKTPVEAFKTLYGEGFDNVNENTIAGNISLKYFKKAISAQLAFGRGTRSATMLERYVYHFAIAADGYEYVGNPFLKPEINNQLELSLAYNKEYIKIGANVFYSVLKDYISALYKDGDSNFKKVFDNPFPYAKQFINVDAVQHGIEGFVIIKLFKNFELSSNLSYTYSENTTQNEPLPQIPPMMTKLGLKYENKILWIDVRATIASKQNRLATSFGEKTETPGYNTIDFRTGFKPLKNFSIGAAILNIFDTAYYSHLNYTYSNNTNSDLNGKRMYEPGRNISLYLNYKF
jgi:iron complex outermembrane recepter protein